MNTLKLSVLWAQGRTLAEDEKSALFTAYDEIAVDRELPFDVRHAAAVKQALVANSMKPRKKAV
jgi:hypothetical protein